MAKMQAVILAGGVGSRLGKFSEGKPKCLIPIGGKPIIKHQLEALADHGVGPVLVILGYKADEVRETVGDRAEYIVNERYEETNSLYSLLLAREWIQGPFILLNSDLFFHPDILDRVLEEDGNVIAYDSTASGGREQTKIALKERLVLDLGKDLPLASARGESLGLIQFDAEGARILLEQAQQQISTGHEKAWVTEAVRSCCAQIPIYGVNVAGLPWAEVDFPYDLEEARKEVWPAIQKSRSPVATIWKRTRWAAVALAAVMLTVVGWIASSTVGPASIEWDTVHLKDAAKVSLSMAEGRTQTWWRIQKGEAPEVEVDGGGEIRIYSRALLSGSSSDALKCLLAVSLDGQPLDWEVFTAIPDPTVSLAGFTVGERDRLTLTLPPGPHKLTVAPAGGVCDQILVRIRQQE